MKKTFQKALNNLKDRPAEYTIIALMLFIAVLTIGVIGEEWKFWTFGLCMITVSLTLIYVVKSNKPQKSTEPNSINLLPQKLVTVINDLQSINLYHKKVEYHFTLKEIKNDKLWVLLELIHITKNNLDVAQDRQYNYHLFSKRSKDANAEVNDENYNLNGSATAKNNMGYHINTSIPPDEEVKVRFSSLVEYNLNDIEVFLSLRYCENFIFYFHNEVEEIAGKEIFSIFFEGIHPYKDVDSRPKLQNDYKTKIEIRKGLLPFQGIYLNWKIL